MQFESHYGQTTATTRHVDQDATSSHNAESHSPTSQDGAPREMGPNHHLAVAQHKLEQLKTWGVSTYKCTKQAIAERLGKTSRTVNADLERKVDLLRELQQRYNQVLTLTKSLMGHLRQVQHSELRLAEQFGQLASREGELEADFLSGAQVLRGSSANCSHLLAALDFFVSAMDTLCNTTIEDTMITIRNFETARLEYDAYRCDLDTLKRTTTRPPDFVSKLTELEDLCQKHQLKYDQLRSDVEAKMVLLSGNKVRVLKKQLSLFGSAVTAYYSGNRKALETVLKQFSVRCGSISLSR